MKATRYFLPVILLAVLSTEVFAQDPSAKDAIDAYCKHPKWCEAFELSDVRVGKKLGQMGMKYWPVRGKATYHKRVPAGVTPAFGYIEAGTVHDIEWSLVEDGFGGYNKVR